MHQYGTVKAIGACDSNFLGSEIDKRNGDKPWIVSILLQKLSDYNFYQGDELSSTVFCESDDTNSQVMEE